MFGLTEAFRSTYLAPDKLDTHPTSVGQGDSRLPGDGAGRARRRMRAERRRRTGAPRRHGNQGILARPGKHRQGVPQPSRFPGETLVFSGDQVYRDEEGYLYFVARADDMIKTKGFRVSPTEVESEVVRHPDIVDAVAFAVPNISVGEDVALRLHDRQRQSPAGARVQAVPEDAICPTTWCRRTWCTSTVSRSWATPASSTASRSSRRRTSAWAWPNAGDRRGQSRSA